MGEPMNERRRKFKKLAEGRTNKALGMIRKITRLNNPRAYDFSKDDIEKICTALEGEIADLRKHFSAGPPKKIVFKLRGDDESGQAVSA